MSGFYLMHRGWQDSDVFRGEEYSSRDAWIWLIENASWKPTRARIKGEMVDLERGQMTFSVRFLADKWGWSKSRVDRFLKRLAAENMIFTRSKIGTTAGQSAGQGQSIITICNYAEYQDKRDIDRDTADQKIGTTAGQQRDKEEQGNKETIEQERKEEGVARDARARGDYVFSGSTIAVNRADMTRWKTAYHAIPDLAAELSALDAWFETQPESKRKNWFHTTAGALNRKHQEILSARSDKPGFRDRSHPNWGPGDPGHSGIPI